MPEEKAGRDRHPVDKTKEIKMYQKYKKIFWYQQKLQV